MTIALLELPSGVVSLEFAEDDAARLNEAVARHFGTPRTLERSALYDVVEFGGERFLLYHEWDPCLISTSDGGAGKLRLLRDVLAGKPTDGEEAPSAGDE